MSPRSRDHDQHTSTQQRILSIAHNHMQQSGTSALSLRAIARDMGMTAPALYRYFATLDDLITALIVEAFDAFATALEQARDGAQALPLREQLFAVLWDYRRWALEHPVDFQLIYGNPIPGYVAPREVTVPIVVRGFTVLVGLLVALIESGELQPTAPYEQVPESFAQAQALADWPPNVPLLAYYLGIVGWGQIHGMIMLELFGHLPPVAGDTDAYYRIQVNNLMRVMGVKS